VTRLLARSSARFYLRHPAQALLALAGIGLGVAVFVGVTLAIDSSTRAFEQSAQFVRGSSTHRLLPVGRELREQTYVDLVRTRGLRAAPVLESNVRIDGGSGPALTLLGVDPIEESGFRDFTRFAPAGDAASVNRLLTEPGTVLVSDTLVEARPGEGTILQIETDTGVHAVRVIGSLGAETNDLILADISTAQELTGNTGRLSRIELILTEAQARALEATLPPATALVSASTENAAFVELSRAFEINVSALGLLALVVGAFLIYSTMAFAIVQRRKPFAILRALGVSQREIMQTVAVEAVVIGVFGAVLGTALGALLADGLIGGVAATIDDFAFRSAVTVTSPSLWLYVQGCALGLAATLLAAARPLLDAARTDPTLAMQRAAQERVVARRVRRGPYAAGIMLVLAAIILLFPTRSLDVAFAGLACVLAAGALVAPSAIATVARWLEPALVRLGGIGARMAARNVRAHQSRTAVAAAALTIAVATVIGVGMMIGSFRVSLTRWLDTTLTSDIFLNAEQAFDPTELLEALEELPEVSATSQTRFVELPSRFGMLGVRAFAPGARGWGLHVVDGDASSTILSLTAGTHVAIAEPFAYRNELARGDILSLPTPSGPRSFAIAGVYRDYNAGGASVLMPLSIFHEHWSDARVSALGLEIAAPLSLENLRILLRRQLERHPMRITSTEMLKEISLRIFDRTFAVTNVLRTLAGLVAFLGMLSALLAIQLERQHELSILRALGFPPRGLSALMLTETSLTGVAAGLVAIPVGLALAGLLVYVINQRSFGWTMELIVQAPPIAAGVSVAIVASVLAGILPSIRNARPGKGTTLRYE
jgi:putative ABC transport system permease protein